MTTFKVTVEEKPADHIFFDKGSNFGYVINGISGATLNLVRGKTYTFNIDSIGHPFYFTTDSVGGTGFPGSLMGEIKPTDSGILFYNVPLDFPDTAYYQCGIHSNMGALVKATNTKTNGKNTVIDRITEIWTRLSDPLILTYARGDTEHYYIGDQIGLVYRVNFNTSDGEIILDVRKYIPKLNDEKVGLLGLAFHPEFNYKGINRGRFFIYYSSTVTPQRTKHKNVVYYNCLSEFRIINNKVNYANEIIMIRLPMYQDNQSNGGSLAIDHLGYLWLSIGDYGHESQNLSSLRGKILRLDISSPGTYPNYYQIPSNNPYIHHRNSRPEIYAFGFRNPKGISFGIINDEYYVFVTDTNRNKKEQLYSIISKGNYGWDYQDRSWGSWLSLGLFNDNLSIIKPIYEYSTGKFPDFNFRIKNSHIVGGYYVPDIGYILGDSSGMLILLRQNGHKWYHSMMSKYYQKINGLGEDEYGNIYLLGKSFTKDKLTGTVSMINIS